MPISTQQIILKNGVDQHAPGSTLFGAYATTGDHHLEWDMDTGLGPVQAVCWTPVDNIGALTTFVTIDIKPTTPPSNHVLLSLRGDGTKTDIRIQLYLFF